MSGHSAEQVESDIRRCGRLDEYSEVGIRPIRRRPNQATALGDLEADRTHSLLNDPNTGSPANVEASNLYKDNRKEYTKRVRETVEKSWED